MKNKNKTNDLDNFLDSTNESIIESISETAIPESSETVSLDQISEILSTTEQTPKKGKRGRKPKSESKETEQQADAILTASMSYTLIGLTKAISTLTDPKWSIEDDQEANYLANSTIEFLDFVYPNWKKSSPIVNFAMAWSAYFMKRLFTKKVDQKNE